ncbi:PilZ domain-containing protein [Sphingomonas sp. PB2P19]|uniref:PilZ domain-containing protein n=1 Tax=Sphingomonas rhamnosi TaxID=3096156 RepID=UPI002FC964D0
MTEEDGGVQTKRATGRDSLFLVAQFRLSGEAKTRDVRVRNLSEGGLMIELDRMIAVGTAVTLDLRGIGEITGTVAWGTEGRLGIALDAPIDPKKARKPVGVGRPPAGPFVAKVPR